MKKPLLSLVALLMFTVAFGQQGNRLTGRVVDDVSKNPVAGVNVILEESDLTATTGEDGVFTIGDVSVGTDRLLLQSAMIRTARLEIDVRSGLTDLGDIEVLLATSTNELNMLIGVVTEELGDDDFETAVQGVSSTVILSNDVFLNRGMFQLMPFRYRTRGYDNIYSQTFINGVVFNDQLRGVFNYASVGALNDMTRNGNVTNYNQAGNYTFGTLGGSENINMRAGSFAKGTKLTGSYTNRNYYARAMATFATGMQDNGWAFAGSIGGRYAHEGAIEGTSYSNISLAFAAERQWNDGEHSLSLTALVSPVVRGQQGGSLQEVYDLTGNNLYNPNWGLQNGKVRNSRMVRAYDPTVVVSHIWNIDRQTSLTTGLGLHYGRYGNTALNWFNGADPRPDYYRYLPSYHKDSPEDYALYTERWKSNDPTVTQINWDGLYRSNQLNVMSGNGQAIYVVEERRSDLYEASLNSTLNKNVSPNMKLTAGIGARATRSHQFKTVDDLLGASYVLDIDRFSEQDFLGDSLTIQNDLTNPNAQAREGDIYGYNFDIDIQSVNIWVLNEYSGRDIDFYYGTRLTYTGFNRYGYMQNGRFPDESLGRGTRHDFIDYSLKGGLSYKISGRHILSANVAFMTEAPLPNNAYISPRISDRAIDGLESGKVFSADINYNFSTASLVGRASVFQTNFYDQSQRVSYYHDAQRTFINHVLTDMQIVNRGMEVGVTYKLNNSWSFDAIGTLAEYYYANNPMGTMDAENGLFTGLKEEVYLENYYVGGTPQAAGSIGIRYFHNFWFLGLNVNGVGRNYVEVAPIRKLASNFEGINPNNADDMAYYNTLVSQERFDDGYTVDASIGKIFYLKNRRSVNFNFALNNLLNNKNIRTGGFEQGRINADDPGRFPSRYFYMQGFNTFLNASYRF